METPSGTAVLNVENEWVKEVSQYIFFFHPFHFNPTASIHNCMRVALYVYEFLNRIGNEATPQKARSGPADDESREGKIWSEWARNFEIAPNIKAAELDREMRRYPEGTNGLLLLMPSGRDKDGKALGYSHILNIQHAPRKGCAPSAADVVVIDGQSSICYPVSLLKNIPMAINWETVTNTLEPNGKFSRGRSVRDLEVFKPTPCHATVEYQHVLTPHPPLPAFICDPQKLPPELKGWNAAWMHETALARSGNMPLGVTRTGARSQSPGKERPLSR